MGDFVLYRKNKISENNIKSILKTLELQGQKNPRIIEDDSYCIISFKKSISPITNIYMKQRQATSVFQAVVFSIAALTVKMR